MHKREEHEGGRAEGGGERKFAATQERESFLHSASPMGPHEKGSGPMN